MSYIKRIWLHLNSSLWFLPSIIVAGAAALATSMIEIDLRSKADLTARFPRLFGAGADGSRGLLEAIATSMMTITGVTFSITIVALALASTQYTPRILRNFMRNRTSQTVLGVFVGVFVYALLVLRTIRGGADSFVPALSVVVGILLALVSVWVLILFIHHIASSIEASTLISHAADDTIAGFEELFPERSGAAGSDSPAAPNDHPDRGVWQAVASPATGYVQSVDIDMLVELAERKDLILRMEKSVGDFVVRGAPILAIHSDERPRADVCRRVALSFVIGRFRTIDQDPSFGIRQIVDIAIKALSPGVNDSTTAVTCLDYLGSILAELAQRKIENDFRSGENRELRIIARALTFEETLAEAFDQIRESAAGNAAVLVRMLTAIETVARFTNDPSHWRILETHVDLIAEVSQRTIAAAYFRRQVSVRIGRTRAILRQVSSGRSSAGS